MKLPFTSSQTHLSTTGPLPPPPPPHQHQSLQAGALFYEPKSVLDVCHSPISTPTTTAAAAAAPKTEFSTIELVDPLHLDDHGIINQFEEWDSLMKELGLHDDSGTPLPTKSTQLPHFPHFDNPNYPNFDPINPTELPPPPPPHSFDFGNNMELMNQWEAGGEFDFVDELIRISECFETHSLQLAHAILARLNQRLRSPSGKPLQRAAFYFKEALQSLLTGSTRLTRPLSSFEIVQGIKAYKNFSNLSPIPMFSNFTANQAILEAVEGAMIVHVIDFDIGLGGHWASFMKEIADKAEHRKVNPQAINITAVVPEEYEMESRLIRDNLCQFARDLKIRFDIDFLSIRTFEFLSFKAIKFIDGEKTAVILSPTIFRRIGAGFINDLRRISPHVIVHVDSDGLVGGGTSSLRQTLIDGLEFYSTIIESLEAANVGGGGIGGDWIRKIEMFVLLPRILAVVEAAGRRATPWREAFTGAGMRPVGLSQFADFQAECLLRRVQVRGFHVVKRQAEMMLCWHDRPLVATSAWRC